MANPKKPPQIENILRRNKDKLLVFLKNFHNPTQPQYIEPLARCAPAGVPKSLIWHGYEIRQYPGYVLFLFNSGTRIVHLDGKPHLPANVKLWNADSRGHWEGNTLVIETTNQNGREWLDNVGNFYSENAHITERITMVDADTLLWEARIEDPNVYTRPWTMTFPLRRNKTPGFQLIEFACHEGNKSPELQLRRDSQ